MCVTFCRVLDFFHVKYEKPFSGSSNWLLASFELLDEKIIGWWTSVGSRFTFKYILNCQGFIYLYFCDINLCLVFWKGIFSSCLVSSFWFVWYSHYLCCCCFLVKEFKFGLLVSQNVIWKAVFLRDFVDRS